MTGTPRRRRVVMLVDNDVRRDSRVQKAARSIADRGWDVQMLGMAPRARHGPRRWRIGGAQVSLVPVATRPGRRVVPLWKNPLGYGGPVRAKRHEAVIAGTIADLLARQAVASPTSLPARADWFTRTLALRLTQRWVEFRIKRTRPPSSGDRIRKRQRSDSQGASPVPDSVHIVASEGLDNADWRRADPTLLALEAAFGPAIDDLDPDVIHANDFRMLGVGSRAKIRAKIRGRPVPLIWDAHEYLPGIRPWSRRPEWKAAQLAHEREYAPFADEVVTVSEELATLLHRDHQLSRPPTVVLNCPVVGETSKRTDPPSVRRAAGLPDDVPILVYSGTPAPQRGLGTVVDALPLLPGVACALVVARPEDDDVRSLIARATALGVADRVHVLPYVKPDEIVNYLASADVGLIPLHHHPNHEIALITKFFEYTHARLPIVVSEVRAMADQVRRTGQGEVFRTEDVADFARAVSVVLEDPGHYRSAIEALDLDHHWTWEEQASVLDGVYRRALDEPGC